MNNRGLGLFIAAAFALGFAGQIIGLQTGLFLFRDPSLLNTVYLIAMLCVPAFAALVARTMTPDSVDDTSRLWPIPLGPALRLTLLVHVLVLLSYLIPLAAGMARIDWTMGELGVEIAGLGLAFEQNEQTAMALPILALSAGPILMVVLGATAYALVALGSEWGWRGYMLPRLLLALPAWAAHIVAGVLWVFWFLPAILTFYMSAYDLARFTTSYLVLALVSVAVAVFLGEIWRRTHHLGLCALALGALAVHAQQGLFSFLILPSIEGLLWTGPFGLVSAVLFLLATLGLRFALGRQTPAPGPPDTNQSLNPSHGM